MDEHSRELVAINTHKDLFQYTRLPFGVSAASAIFQRCMENLLQGCQGVSVYLDDILVTGSIVEDHLTNLDKVLSTMTKAGLTLNQAKCKFLLPSVEYLGHVIYQHGVHHSQEKVKAIKEAPEPHKISELRSFLGIINYYARLTFLPNLSTKLTPLYNLLQKEFKWEWSQKQAKAFMAAKDALQDDALLIHYDSSKQLVLACDASPYGLGAVLSHIMEDSLEKPIAYASRTLTAAEKNYSQLEKEALAVVHTVGKFHNYLYGRKIVIESDHQALSYIFSDSKAISPTASSRIKRWGLTFYSYTIKHKPGKNLGNADALSHLPQRVTTDSDCIPGDLVHLLNHLETTTVSSSHIRRWTDKDPTLSKVRQYIL